jgi:hypothetical protein
MRERRSGMPTRKMLWYGTPAVSDYNVAELLDDLAEAIVTSPDRGAGLRHLRVNPKVYDVIAEAKARELARGNPLLLLGMEVEAVYGLPPNAPEMS